MSVQIPRPRRALPARQRGATLFVALMILLLLTVLALSVAQVTGLQERMAGTYRSDAQAFQQAEAQLREVERSILNTTAPDPEVCFEEPESIPDSWLDSSAPGTTTCGTTGANGGCAIANMSLDVGSGLQSSATAGEVIEVGSVYCAVFSVTSLQFDDPAEPVSRAVIQSTFVP